MTIEINWCKLLLIVSSCGCAIDISGSGAFTFKFWWVQIYYAPKSHLLHAFWLIMTKTVLSTRLLTYNEQNRTFHTTFDQQGPKSYVLHSFLLKPYVPHDFWPYIHVLHDPWPKNIHNRTIHTTLNKLEQPNRHKSQQNLIMSFHNSKKSLHSWHDRQYQVIKVKFFVDNTKMFVQNK